MNVFLFLYVSFYFYNFRDLSGNQIGIIPYKDLKHVKELEKL